VGRRQGRKHWVKMTETIIDSGGWSRETIMCGRAPDHIIAGKKPRVMFRVDNATFEFKSFRSGKYSLRSK
jgi:hypothetical protein